MSVDTTNEARSVIRLRGRVKALPIPGDDLDEYDLRHIAGTYRYGEDVVPPPPPTEDYHLMPKRFPETSLLGEAVIVRTPRNVRDFGYGNAPRRR